MEAWTVRPGETVLLRIKRSLSPDYMAYTREQLERLTERLGIHFVLLDAEVEVVNPHTGDGA